MKHDLRESLTELEHNIKEFAKLSLGYVGLFGEYEKTNHINESVMQISKTVKGESDKVREIIKRRANK